MAVINENSFRSVINDILDEYGDEALEAIEAAATETAKKVVRELKKGGDYGGTGEFNKGWTSKREVSRLGSTTVVYNRTQPGLAHLLEYGHAKQNGGRTKAFNFIAPVADEAESTFLEAFTKKMGG